MDTKENIHPEELKNLESSSEQPDQNSAPKDEEEISYISLGVAIGVSLGTALGLTIFDNLGLGMGVGIALGVAIGAALDLQNKNKK